MKVRKRKTKETNRPIFSKKSINEPNELNTSAVEIPMYAPNMGLAPKDYQLSPKLTELEETFEGICKAFLKAANPDMFNSSYMDAIIERTIVEALKFIRVQRCDHERLITENLMAMHKGDYCVVMELSYTPLWKSVFTKCTDVNSDGIWCCGGVKYPSTCYRKISTWSHIQDYETRINNVCCIRGRISSCLWWDSVSALRI